MHNKLCIFLPFLALNLFKLISFLIKWVILRPLIPNILFVALLRFVHFGPNVIKNTSF
jgi:hypothetical protein